MALEAFLNSNTKYPLSLELPANGPGGILEALQGTYSSLKNKEHLDSLLGVGQPDTNFASDIMNYSALLGKASNSRSPVGRDDAIQNGAYLQNQRNIIESYINLPPSSPMPFSSDKYNPANVFPTDAAFSLLFQGERDKRRLENYTVSTDLYKSNSRALNPVLKKPRLSINQLENIYQNQQQQEIIQELLLKELQDLNPQVKAMMKKYREQSQLQHPILHASPYLKGFNLQLQKHGMRSLVQNQGNLQQVASFAPLLDGSICSRRLKQYLYHLRNNTHDNSIGYWKKFVSEYYAPGSKKRWCFCRYENIELHATGVFCPKSMETWSCDICGSRSGKGLETTFDIFPRLFKVKFESGMLDEILFLDLPRACKISSGVVLEYGKAVQESVYEKFRVVHEGKLRIVFGHDLKILSWEFCAQNHEEFLLRRLVTSQINDLVQAAEKYQSDTPNRVSYRVSSDHLQPICDMFVSAGNQLARNMELPLVNDLGYPKRFIRCLQIAEVVDSMKDLMALSCHTKMGPIESLNTYRETTHHNMKEKQGMELAVAAAVENQPTFAHLNPIPLVESFNTYRETTHHHMKEKQGMELAVAAAVENQTTFAHLNQFLSKNSSIASSVRRSAGKISKAATSHGGLSVAGRTITVKAEPYSPEQLPEAFRVTTTGFSLSNIDDFRW